MIKLYLDIDGVLLTAKNTKAAPNGIAFLDYIIPKFDCYWLTTHCRDGSNAAVMDRMSKYYPEQIIKKLQSVKPVKWNTLKTEAIDFDSSFFWIDDNVFEAEKNILKQRGCMNKLLLVDLNRENELLRICSDYL